MDIFNEISKRIIRIRREKRMTQEQLGGKIERSQAWVAKLEKGNEKISIEMLYSLANALECSIYEVLPPDNEGQCNGQ